MLRFALGKQLQLLAAFHVEKFGAKDYKTMCSLIRQKYPIYNEAIQLHKDIRLFDENNKLIGVYGASQARRKASTMKKDIVLVNYKSTPAVCKIISFRESILQKFYDQIVTKRNEQLIKKATSTKQLKIPLTLNEKEFQIKEKQLLQLAKKNYNVRVFINCKANQTNDALTKMETLKSLIQNKCIIEKDVRFEQTVKKDDDYEDSKEKKEERFTYSMVIKSRDNQFMNLLKESSEKEPESAIETFLKRYYKQQDVDMKDLKATAQLNVEAIMEEPSEKDITVAPVVVKEKKLGEEQTTIKILGDHPDYSEEQIREMKEEYSYQLREAKARILNERLRRILASRTV